MPSDTAAVDQQQQQQESTKPHFWLRDEVKPLERRTALTPQNAKALIEEENFEITVERSELRCFKDEEYERAGCKLVDSGSWVNAPPSAVIFGLKELPEGKGPLTHEHVYFAHCYKNQRGWKDLLQRFDIGNGKLYDLEFLTDNNLRRVAAFGRSAGFVGMAVGLLLWCKRHLVSDESTDQPLGHIEPYNSYDDLVAHVQASLDEVVAAGGPRHPSTVIIGALGRVGKGADEMAKRVGINCELWDLKTTAKGGPFPELLNFEVVVNCICLLPGTFIPPFIDRQMLDSPWRKLMVVNDISCDFTNPSNPLPFYSDGTDFDKPSVRVIPGSFAIRALDVTAIDHLPSLVPTESSSEFSDALMPHLRQYATSDVWTRALTLFHEKLALSKQ